MLLILITQSCYALAVVASTSTYSKIISRKSDGQYKIYNLINDGKDTDGIDDIHDNRQHIFHPSAALYRVQSALRSTFLPALPNSSNAKENDNNNGNNYQMDKLRQSGYMKYILFDNIQDLSTS